MTTLKLYITSSDNVFHCDVIQDEVLSCQHILKEYNEAQTLEINTFNVSNELSRCLCVTQDKIEVPVRMACLLKEYSFSYLSL
jgi:hypothetical protein